MAGLSGKWRLLRRAQRLGRAGRTDAALAAFEAAGEAGDVRVSVQHALALSRAGRADEAAARAGRAADATPMDAVAAMAHAYLLLRAGRVDAAEVEVARARDLAPGNPIPRTLAAAVEVMRGRLVAGCRQLLEGPVTDNLELLGWVLAVVERKVFESVGTASGALPPEPEEGRAKDEPPAELPEMGADAALRKGERFLERGQPKTAAKYLERAAELKPDDADRRLLLGAALFEAGEFERAEAELLRGPKEGATAGVVQFYRAANAYRLGRYDEAVQLIDTLPEKGEVFHYREWCGYVRGMALIAQGRVDEASCAMAAFLDVEPTLLRRRLSKAIEVTEGKATCCTSC